MRRSQIGGDRNFRHGRDRCVFFLDASPRSHASRFRSDATLECEKTEQRWTGRWSFGHEYGYDGNESQRLPPPDADFQLRFGSLFTEPQIVTMSEDQVTKVYYDPAYAMVFTPNKHRPFHSGELCKSGEAALSAGQGSGVGCVGEQGAQVQQDRDCGPTMRCEVRVRTSSALAPPIHTPPPPGSPWAPSPNGHQMTHHEADAKICRCSTHLVITTNIYQYRQKLLPLRTSKSSLGIRTKVSHIH